LKNQLSFPLTNRKPGEIIAFDSRGARRVDQFLGEAVNLSKQLPARRYAINLFTDRYQYLLGFTAAIIAGQCTLMPPNRLKATLELLGEMFPDSYTLGDNTLADCEISRNVSRSGPPGEFPPDIPEISAEQLCAIAFTSGSTGTPTPNHKYWGTLRTGTLGNSE